MGDTVAYKIKTSVSNGKFLPTNISDVIAQGMEVVPDSTYVYYENDSASKTKLNDEAIWNDQQLSITDSALPTTVNENGVTSGKNLIVEYQVKIKNSLKGETVVSNKTKIEGQNKFKYNEHKQTYQAESNSVTLKVKTDVIINFKDIEDNLLNPSFITSKNSSFNQKNPIVIYLDTGDSYDYTSVLKEISDNLLKNENLVEISSQGNRTSTSIPKEGEQITLTYTSVATVTVEFVNEANQVMPGYTMILDTQVGDTLDLTTEPKVQTQLTNLMNAGYEIVKRPTNESALKVQQVATTVQYQIQGVLSLTSVPSTLDFGTLSYDATKKRVEDPSYDEQLVVTDTRADASNGWRLTASLSTPMTNSSGQELRNALRYMTKGKETILTKDSQVVYTNNKGTAGSYDVSDSWGTTDNTDGIKLQIESSDTVYTGDYVGVITWVVMAGQP